MIDRQKWVDVLEDEEGCFLVNVCLPACVIQYEEEGVREKMKKSMMLKVLGVDF